MKRLTLSIILVFLVSLSPSGQAFAFLLGQTQSGGTFQDAEHFLVMREKGTLLAHTSTIMSVLEERIENQEVLAKTREKLLTLSNEEIGLVSSLCDLIANEERTAQAEIAFSLVTALIVLS